MEASELSSSMAEGMGEVDRELRLTLRAQKGVPKRLAQAMAHSVLGGGKRLRPLLMLWAYEAMGGGRRAPVNRSAVMRAACSLEMLHTYSLIHDDLPAMDDDVLRRGRPTCHVAYDEATAILAGDALHALAFGLLADAGGRLGCDLVARVVAAVGPAGMVGGQQDDLEAEGIEVTAALVRRIHLRKTARLIAVSLTGGALLAGAPRHRQEAVEDAGIDLGLAFQGADDILDLTATEDQLGKSVGKDEASGKATWVRVEGLEKARDRTRRYGRRGLRKLDAALPAGPHRDRLLALGSMMWNRDH
ncbi:polyprenyl synthetase family protein [bacterium]|nr:MAG: polyprenyl synthetase family protein [bacterium]